MSNRDILGKIFYEFEKKYSSAIKEIEISDFNAWQIIKYPLYWHIINQTVYHQDDRNGSLLKAYFKTYSAKLYRQLIKIKYFISFLISFFSEYVRKINKPNLVLFYTKSADKKIKGPNGKYFNPLTDYFIVNKFVPFYVYVEIPDRGKFRKPGTVKTDIEIHNLVVLNLFLFKKSSSKRNIATATNRLFELVKNGFEPELFDIQISKTIINRTLNAFYDEFNFFTFLLKCINPKLIITSEEMGFGFQAAAKTLSIKSIDLQHGIIDRFHPQYIYAEELRNLKSRMSIPDYIGVFGIIHKEQLLNNGFWEESEIILLGNSNIEGIRRKLEIVDYTKSKDPFILIPTQRFVNFRETIVLLEALSLVQKPNFRIVLKMHPLEPEPNIEEYRLMALKKPGFIEVAHKEADIYDIINRAILVVGFDSMALLDAISLCKPCITLTTESAPKGIHEFFWTNELEQVIKPVRVTDVEGLVELISQTVSDKVFYNHWKELSIKVSDRLNCRGYYENCKAFICSFFSAN
jgi:hypothetical protein